MPSRNPTCDRPRPVCGAQEVVSRLPLCTAEEFNAAVASSKDAFAKWRAVPVPQRARVMFRLQVGARGSAAGAGAVGGATPLMPRALLPGLLLRRAAGGGLRTQTPAGVRPA